MSCLNLTITLSNKTPSIEISDVGSHLKAYCSLVCDLGFVGQSYAWSDSVRLVWDNGGLVLIDREE